MEKLVTMKEEFGDIVDKGYTTVRRRNVFPKTLHTISIRSRMRLSKVRNY